ncbi:MAG: hypothetical protein WKF52_09820 [Sphingomicrobium sp.]
MLGAASFGLAVAATPASAQHIDQIVAFGDSYADDGNLFELIGIPCPSVYSTGRFSGGTNYVDTLSQILGHRFAPCFARRQPMSRPAAAREAERQVASALTQCSLAARYLKANSNLRNPLALSR